MYENSEISCSNRLCLQWKSIEISALRLQKQSMHAWVLIYSLGINILIYDDTIWTQKISSPELNTPMSVLDESYEGTNQQQQEVLHGIGFGPKILDTIADRVVDKIAHDGASAGAKPKFTIKEDKE